MIEELKPCPCCEGFASLHFNAIVFRGQFYEGYGSSVGHRVECEGECHLMTCWWHTREEATTAWNTRAPYWRPIETLPEEYLHTEELVMIKLAHGIVSAWFEPYRTFDTPDGIEHDGGMWIALDDDLQFEMDSVTHWALMIEENK